MPHIRAIFPPSIALFLELWVFEASSHAAVFSIDTLWNLHSVCVHVLKTNPINPESLLFTNKLPEAWMLMLEMAAITVSFSPPGERCKQTVTIFTVNFPFNFTEIHWLSQVLTMKHWTLEVCQKKNSLSFNMIQNWFKMSQNRFQQNKTNSLKPPLKFWWSLE